MNWRGALVTKSLAIAGLSGGLLVSCASGQEDGVGFSVPAGSATFAPPGASASATPSASVASPRVHPPIKVFARMHDDALLLPNQPKSVPAVDALTRYSIELRIDDIAGTLTGQAIIRYTNDTGAPLTRLPLVLHANASEELGVADGKTGSLHIRSVERISDDGEKKALEVENVRPTLVRVLLASPVPDAQLLTVRVTFDGTLRRLGAGANDMFTQAIGSLSTLSGTEGAADYGLLAEGDGLLTAANAYPTIAAHRNGSFDVAPPARLGDVAYNRIASFEVQTTLPRGVRLVSNLVDDVPLDGGDGWATVHSKGTHVREFVLVAGRDLERTAVEVGDTRVTSVYLARDADGGKRVLDMAAASLESFERRFGPYPYRELDVVEASLVGGAGGVEFSGLVLIAGMLYRDPITSNPLLSLLGRLGGGGPGGGADPMAQMQDTLAKTLDFTVAHEVAHQYFAGIVGNDSRRFPSLDEPIAQYAAGLAMGDRYGAAVAKRAMDTNVKMNYAMYRMLGGADKAVLRDTSSFATPVEYAALVYGKAPYVYTTLSKKLGEKKLHDAIAAAIDDHRFGIVTTEEWIGAIERGVGGPSSGVRPTFKRWLEQKHGDQDLGVDASGDFVIDAMLPPELAKALKQNSGGLLDPRTLMKTMMGGGL